MYHPQKCCQCFQAFNQTKIARCLPGCEHKICGTCLDQTIQNNFEMISCYFCSNIIQKQKIYQFPVCQVELRGFYKQECSITGNNESNRMQAMMIEREEDLLMGEQTQSNTHQLQSICALHKTVQDILCITDKIKICAHCALFGKHKEHKFTRFQDFYSEISSKKATFQKLKREKNDPFGKQHLKNLKGQIVIEIENKRNNILWQIDKKFKSLLQDLSEVQSSLKKQVLETFLQIEGYLKMSESIIQTGRTWQQLSNWQEKVQATIRLLEKQENIEDKLKIYYDGPLQFVSSCDTIIQRFMNEIEMSLEKIKDQIKFIELKMDNNALEGMKKKIWLSKTASKESLLQNHSDFSNPEVNPFLNYSISSIHNRTQSTFFDTTNLDESLINKTQISSNIRAMIGSPKNDDAKNLKSPQKSRLLKAGLSPRVNYNKSPKVNKIVEKSRLSLKSPSKFLNITSPTEQYVPYSARCAEEIYIQFVKNNLTDIFDISECYLSNEKVVSYVSKARKIHKVRGLKLSYNFLTSQGFLKMIESLQGVSNINLCGNRINEQILNLILKYRESFESLKMINLAENHILIDKKAASKVQDIKKLGIIIVL